MTSVGYMPIIQAPAHELDTVNTVVLRCKHTAGKLGQHYCQISPTQRRLLHAETGGQPGGPARRGALQAVVRRTVVVERERERTVVESS